MSKISTPPRKRNARLRVPFFTVIPRELLVHPPIAHRHLNDEQRVSAFEFNVLATLLALGKTESDWSKQVDAGAWSAGDAGIDEELGNDQEHNAKWRRVNAVRRDQRQEHRGQRLTGQHPGPLDLEEAPKRNHAFDADRAYEAHNLKVAVAEMTGYQLADMRYRNRYRPFPKPEALRRAGREGNRKYRQHANRHPPTTITIELSCYALLKAAGLGNNAGNRRQLLVALDRLQHGVGGLPPPLHSWQLDDGVLRIQLDGQWLPARRFALLPMPLPKAPTTLALLLFLFGVNTGALNQTGIRFRNLCRRLGIATTSGAADSGRTLRRALDQLNAYVKDLDAETLRRYKLSIPGGYEIVPVNGGASVRFVHYSRPHRDDEAPEQPMPMRRRAKTLVKALPRVRLTAEARQRLQERATIRRIRENCTGFHERASAKLRAYKRAEMDRTIKALARGEFGDAGDATGGASFRLRARK